MWVRGCWTHPACYLRPGPVTSTGNQTTEHKTLLLMDFSKYQGPWSRGIHDSFHPEFVTESQVPRQVWWPKCLPGSSLSLSYSCQDNAWLIFFWNEAKSGVIFSYVKNLGSTGWKWQPPCSHPPSPTQLWPRCSSLSSSSSQSSDHQLKMQNVKSSRQSYHHSTLDGTPVPHYHHLNHYPQVIAGLENNHCCSLLAPLLSPRLTILKITEHPSYLAETELVKLFQRLPSCSTLQNIQLSAKVRDNIFHNLVVMPSNFISLLIQVTSLISEPLSMLLLTNPPASLRSLILSNCNTLLPSPQVVLVMMKIMSKIEKKMWGSGCAPT